jgi:hypothetical protein
MKKRGNHMTEILIALAVVLLVAAFFMYQTDKTESETAVNAKDSFIVRTDENFEKVIAGLVDLEKVVTTLRENVGAKFSEQERINAALTNHQAELVRKINESEKHLDLRISKMQSAPMKQSEPVKVNIVGPITLERVTAAPVKKSLGKGLKSMIPESAK